MSNQRKIWQIVLADRHKPTGRTTHLREGEKLAAPNQLLIAQLSDDPGYYLLYLDAAGNELTDTYHDTVENAMRQAEFEFGVRCEDWSAAKD